MGIVSQKKESVGVKISEDDKQKIISAVNEQDVLYSSLGVLQLTYETNKNQLFKSLESQKTIIENVHNSIELQYGKGNIDIENWTFVPNKGD